MSITVGALMIDGISYVGEVKFTAWAARNALRSHKNRPTVRLGDG